MFELIKELHKIATNENLKRAPEKSFYILPKKNSLDKKKGATQLNQTHQKLKPSKESHHQKKRKMLCSF